MSAVLIVFGASSQTFRKNNVFWDLLNIVKNSNELNKKAFLLAKLDKIYEKNEKKIANKCASNFKVKSKKF